MRFRVSMGITAGLAGLFLTTAAMGAAAPRVLEQRSVAADHRIELGQVWKVELPKLKAEGARLLKLTVRLQSPTLGGYGSYMYLAINGHPVDAAQSRYAPRLLNKSAAFVRPNGQQIFWNRGDGIWLTIFAPSFTTDFKQYGPHVAEPYTYLLDVTDLVNKDGSNELQLGNMFPGSADPKSDKALVASVEWVAAPPRSDQEPAPARPKVVTQPRVTITPDGAIQFPVGDKPLRIESTFSVPEGGQNRLGGASQEQGWKPKIQQRGERQWRIEARGAFYKLVRTIRQTDGRIAVEDRFENTSDKEIGILFSNELNLEGHRAIDYCRIGGKRGQGINHVNSRENPTLFFPLEQSSLTLVAEDDVYRNQADFYFDAKAHRSGIADPMFALAPGASYTVKWSIYLEPTEDYYDMINRVRRDWGANITIPGPIYFVNYRNIAHTPQAALDQAIKKSGARYFCFWELRTPSAQPQWDNKMAAAYGPGIWDPMFKPEIELVKQAVAKLHAAGPDVKVALYSHCFFICPERPEDTTFKDSWITNADGSRKKTVYNSKDYYPYRPVFPTPGNSYGKAYMKVVDFYLNDLKLDWLYWDESNGPGVTVERGDSLEAYLTYNAWDGHSAKIDQKTGLIRQNCGFLTLLSDKFIDGVVEKFKERRGFVLFNGAATTRRRMHSPSFVETQWDITLCYRTHLNTPLAYGVGNPTMLDLRRRLDFAMVYDRTPLGRADSAVSRSFPFTPIELHEGWVKGKERIITKKSGRFGWGDAPFAAALYLYDAQGKLERTEALDGPQTAPVSIDVPENGMAILEREGGGDAN
jgi:hypothetical protein